MHISAMVVSALAAVAQAVDVQVVSVASTNNTLKFFPDKISAPVGSMVQFQFRGGNHSVVQSTFDNPCIPISNVNASAKGVYSGYQPVAASAAMGQIPVFTVMVSSTAPMWLYCSQAKHCQNGMVMVINENWGPHLDTRAALGLYRPDPGGGASGGSGGGSASPTGGAGGGSGGGSNGGGSGNGGAGGASPSSPPTAGAVSITVPGTLLLALGAGFLLL
ncbi:extracellular serine-rich protein ARB_03024 [Colletotrichum liriopes]|uniref:Extracellular serine-rich protein ARB_03024 n=1 Tax=Colletotrichum liriopes TaxID=708192 RepID=A0AA37GSD7_9PEZI|nr:extracellular serine-rich protein ARB_03024 [Colletotrichum liriopes]